MLLQYIELDFLEFLVSYFTALHTRKEFSFKIYIGISANFYVFLELLLKYK